MRANCYQVLVEVNFFVVNHTLGTRAFDRVVCVEFEFEWM